MSLISGHFANITLMELNPQKSHSEEMKLSACLPWLNKGLKELRKKRIFSHLQGSSYSGGKHMVNSIRHWLNAYQIIDFSGAKPYQTKFGRF